MLARQDILEFTDLSPDMGKHSRVLIQLYRCLTPILLLHKSLTAGTEAYESTT